MKKSRNDSASWRERIYNPPLTILIQTYTLDSTMAQLVLSINPAVTPVPWGPLVLSSLVNSTGANPVVDIQFGPTTPTIALLLLPEGNTISTDPLEITERIAAAAEVSGDSTKVCISEGF